MGEKLPRDFYDRPTLEVAQGLLGKRLVRTFGRTRLSGVIVETEAYLGPADAASHARFGPTSRASPMFGEPGHAYIYFTYGMHHCMNAVTEGIGSGTGVLIRALEPSEGQEQMRRNRLRNRKAKTRILDTDLCSGPGKLCQALGLDISLNHADLSGNILWIEAGKTMPTDRIGKSPRVGIREGREHPWRFYVADSPHVSAHPKY